MRSFVRALALGLVVLAGCSDQQATQPNGPQAFRGPTSYLVCPTIDAVRVLVRALFPVGPTQTAANKQVTQIFGFAAVGKLTDARGIMFQLVQTVLSNYYAGTLTGGQSPGTQANVLSLINALYCVVGLPQPNLPLGTLGNDGAAAVVTPTSPTTLVRTGTQFAGVNIPAASVPTTTLITITRLPDAPGPLLTPLDQYPAFYEFTASPVVAFTQDLLVGTCTVQDFTPPDFGRLKIAHNVGATVELLPRTVAPFLDCTGLIGMGPDFPGLRGYAQRGWRWAGPLVRDLFLPRPAYATMLGSCCLGGTTKKFSPFGAVDTLTILNGGLPNSISGGPGRIIPAGDLPGVQLLTPTLKPIAGVTITFSVPAGSEGTITGAVQVTDANGRATVGGWTLGTSLGVDSVIATATPITGTAIQSNGRLFEAVVQ